jgi:putative ATP-binding cassette transporter
MRRGEFGIAFGGLREAWGLIRPYFVSSEERWSARGLLAAVIGLNLILTALNVEYTYFTKYIYDALQDYNLAAFLKLMFTYDRVPAFPYFMPGFVSYVIVLIVVSVYALYLNQILQIRWRRWMTNDFSARWLDGRAHYALSLANQGIVGVDNPDQRISDDLNDFTTNALSLGLDLLSNVVTLLSFITVLFAISGSIKIFGVTIPGYMVWLALIYSAGGTVITHLIGRRLIWLNFNQQRVEANFRYSLIRVRENPEAIALSGGEAEELVGLRERFTDVWENFWLIMRRTKLLGFFTSGFGTIAGNFALLAASPRYFAHTLQLGGLLQLGQVFGNVQSPMSWIVNSYPNLVALSATTARLHSFSQAVAAAREAATTGPQRHDGGTALSLSNLTLTLPGGRTLVENASLTLPPGAPIFLTGPSGAGKSTLMRAIAGIWPHGEGTVSCPEGRVLFLPQRPYFPLGALKRAITYPDAPDATQDDKIIEALQAVELADLATRLHDTENWGQVLSGGEQQRLSLARAVIAQPDWLFLDEALSALDDPLAEKMQAMLAARLPKTTVVAITHRDRLGAKHRHISLAGGALTEHPRLAAE